MLWATNMKTPSCLANVVANTIPNFYFYQQSPLSEPDNINAKLFEAAPMTAIFFCYILIYC